jgi:hypothetical protein
MSGAYARGNGLYRNACQASSGLALRTAGQRIVKTHLRKRTLAADVAPALWAQMYVRPFGISERGYMDAIFVQAEHYQVVRRRVFNLYVRMDHCIAVANGFNETILK